MEQKDLIKSLADENRQPTEEEKIAIALRNRVMVEELYNRNHPDYPIEDPNEFKIYESQGVIDEPTFSVVYSPEQGMAIYIASIDKDGNIINSEEETLSQKMDLIALERTAMKELYRPDKRTPEEIEREAAVSVRIQESVEGATRADLSSEEKAALNEVFNNVRNGITKDGYIDTNKVSLEPTANKRTFNVIYNGDMKVAAIDVLDKDSVIPEYLSENLVKASEIEKKGRKTVHKRGDDYRNQTKAFGKERADNRKDNPKRSKGDATPKYKQTSYERYINQASALKEQHNKVENLYEEYSKELHVAGETGFNEKQILRLQGIAKEIVREVNKEMNDVKYLDEYCKQLKAEVMPSLSVSDKIRNAAKLTIISGENALISMNSRMHERNVNRVLGRMSDDINVYRLSEQDRRNELIHNYTVKGKALQQIAVEQSKLLEKAKKPTIKERIVDNIFGSHTAAHNHLNDRDLKKREGLKKLASELKKDMQSISREYNNSLRIEKRLAKDIGLEKVGRVSKLDELLEKGARSADESNRKMEMERETNKERIKTMDAMEKEYDRI